MGIYKTTTSAYASGSPSNPSTGDTWNAVLTDGTVPTWIVSQHGGQYNQSSPPISTITFGLFNSGASFQTGRFMVYGIA